MEEKNQEEEVKKALLKRALGYEIQEKTKEFNFDEEGNKHLLKEKVNVKHFAPDITAIKLFLTFYSNHNLEDLEMLSDEELIRERDNLLKLLNLNNNDNNI